MKSNRELRNEYRCTWDAFACALAELQRLVEAGERDGADAALLAVEEARVAHNDARDRLAAQMIGSGLPRPAEEMRVRRTARRLWELSGKPQGTAERDWLRAETLVRSAAAGCAGSCA